MIDFNLLNVASFVADTISNIFRMLNTSFYWYLHFQIQKRQNKSHALDFLFSIYGTF